MLPNRLQSHHLCSICQLGKQCRLFFNDSNSITNFVLDKLHCDLWRQTPIKSNQGFLYYAILIYDFTRCSLIYPFRKKSDIYLVHQISEND